MKLTEELLNTIRDYPNFPTEGVIFKDINPILRSPSLLKKVISKMAEHASQVNAQHVVGIESRGFFFGIPLALELSLPFVAARKKGKLPGEVITEKYSLEYGRDAIEIQKEAIYSGERYFIVDDVIATGGTASAAAKIIESSQAEVCAFSFFIELSFLNGRKTLLKNREQTDFRSLLKFS